MTWFGKPSWTEAQQATALLYLAEQETRAVLQGGKQ
jgi:hypothetical protein